MQKFLVVGWLPHAAAMSRCKRDEDGCPPKSAESKYGRWAQPIHGKVMSPFGGQFKASRVQPEEHFLSRQRSIYQP